MSSVAGGAADGAGGAPVGAGGASAVATASSPATRNGRLTEVESLLVRMRAARTAAHGGDGVHLFPTTVVTARSWAAEISHEPGAFSAGLTWVDYRVRIGTDEGDRDDWRLEVEGRFCVVVSDDASADVPAAEWSVRSRDGRDLPLATVSGAEQLPRSAFVPRLGATRRARAMRRLAEDGAVARAELARSQRPLARKVVDRLRGELGNERGAVDVDELEHVALLRIVEVAEHWFAGPADDRPATAGWSKVAHREATAAVRREIVAATGVSAEFRQLLEWMRQRPDDRARPTEHVAYAMAHAAGASRLVQARQARDRTAAEVLLDAMLRDGRAVYVAAGTAPGERHAHRVAGTFVVSPRSSLAEIDRAQRHAGGGAVALDAPATDGAASTIGERFLADDRDHFGDVDNRLFLDAAMTAHAVSPLEAHVWCAHSGVLGGGAAELAEIADELGLVGGRAEARSALRRAWRKLDTVGAELVSSAA